ncbi:MAG: amidohydrolase family protein [Acidimicrobiia bacterium]
MSDLPYQILDSDNHFTEPPTLYQDYIDPKQRHLAITFVGHDATGRDVQLFAGKPSRFTVEGFTEGITEVQKSQGLDTTVEGENFRLPGRLLNRLNPLKGLSPEERKEVIALFRSQSEAFGNRDLRLALMDEQGIEAALMYPASAHDIEFEFDDNVEAMYANIRAFNRWIYEEIGYAADNRMFLPPYIALADVDLALKELEILIETGAPMIQIKSGHAHGGADNPYGGRSPADPIFDPIWSRVNEAGLRLCVHLGATDYQKYGRDWSENADLTFGKFSNFQWMMYWGDRPAMELTAGLILQDFFGRFPNIKVCLSEMGTVWVPYTMRKMDHSFMLGRKSAFGKLTKRPSQIFKEHFVVAPYPEENVTRVVAEVGIEPIVFGSDFPHGEGLAYPAGYVTAQLSNFSDADQKRIMRDNLADFLRLPK